MLKQNHILLTTAEVDQAIAEYAMRKQGVDPEGLEPHYTAVYRINDGKIIASIHFDAITPRQKEQP